MLRGRGEFRVGGGRLAFDLTVTPGVASVAVVREHLRYDTRYSAASEPTFSDGVVVYLVLEGEFTWNEQRIRAPLAFAMPAAKFDVRTQDMARCRVTGARVRVIELWLGGQNRPPGSPEVLSEETVSAAERFMIAAAPGEDSHPSDEIRAQATSELISALARQGFCEAVTVQVLEGPVWERLRAAFGQIDLGASQKMLADGSSVRQFHRDFGVLAGVQGAGFREALRRWRVRLGVVLLSAPNATVAEVSRVLGYSRPEAMNAVFRAAGLSKPSTLRKELAVTMSEPPGPPRKSR